MNVTNVKDCYCLAIVYYGIYGVVKVHFQARGGRKKRKRKSAAIRSCSDPQFISKKNHIQTGNLIEWNP